MHAIALTYAHTRLCIQSPSPRHTHVYASNRAHMCTYTSRNEIALIYANTYLRMQSRSAGNRPHLGTNTSTHAIALTYAYTSTHASAHTHVYACNRPFVRTYTSMHAIAFTNASRGTQKLSEKGS